MRRRPRAGSSGWISDRGRSLRKIRIGAPDQQTAAYIAGIVGVTTAENDAVPVLISGSGQLGVTSSSRRYKEDIRDMGDASARLLRLRPVTFRYKKPFADGEKPIQYGLIAEEVAQEFPELAVRNAKGQPETVKYQLLAPLLLNEFQKEHRQVQELQKELADAQAKMTEYGKRLAEQEKTNATLTAGLAAMQQQVTLVAHKMAERAVPVANVSKTGNGMAQTQ